MPKPACAFGVLLLILTEPIAACEWGPWTVPVALAAGETISNITLKVSDGTLLVFRISDPQRLIQDTAASVLPDGRLAFSDGNFRIGVVVSGRYARAMFVSGQSGVRQYRVAVPKSASMNLFLNTTLNVSQPGYPSIGSDQPSLRILVTGQSEVDVDLQVQ